MDQVTLSTRPRRLVTDLYGMQLGRPAIIVGGGPSAPEQLEQIRGNASFLVISANGHAAKLGLQADYVFCKDHVHTETKQLMEPCVRPLGAPIVSHLYWAEYRTPKWPVQGNSGMQAIALAAMLGCAPIIPIGFDCYQEGTYFHDPKAKNVSAGKKPGYWQNRYGRLKLRLEGAAIRSVGGPLTATFEPYNRHERFPAPVIPHALQHYATLETVVAIAKRDFPLLGDPQCTVPKGTAFAASRPEFEAYHRANVAVEFAAG